MNGRRVLTLLAAALACCGCHQKSSSAGETESSDALTEKQWISAGHMEEYEELLYEYAEEQQIEVVEIWQDGDYGIDQGVICDLNGDGMTPELLRIQEADGGYAIQVVFLANDGALSLKKADILLENGSVPEKLLCSQNDRSGIWDIVIAEKRDGDDYAGFYRFENEECCCYASVPGILEEWNDGGANEAYDFYGVYRIRQTELWEGCVKRQEYEINEASKELVQKLPEFIEGLDKMEAYWTLSGAKYIQLEEQTPIYQIDFSKEVAFKSDRILPIGLLKYDGQNYILIESDQGEMGYIVDGK